VTKNVNYVAVLADAIGSRTLPPKARVRLQADLQTRLRTDLNKRKPWRSGIAARFAIARGDEIEGLLTDAEFVWDIAHWLRGVFADVDWIIACARGPISTALADTALEVDGPCFHAARAALEEAKETRQVFTFRGFSPAVDALAAYYSALYWSWTPRQRRQASKLSYPNTYWRCRLILTAESLFITGFQRAKTLPSSFLMRSDLPSSPKNGFVASRPARGFSGASAWMASTTEASNMA